jgi:hypothetical protein
MRRYGVPSEVLTDNGKQFTGRHVRRAELLDHVSPFGSVQAAQEAIDGWVHGYNHARPHQALDMAVPASRFRPHSPAPGIAAPAAQGDQIAVPWLDTGVIEPPPAPVPRGAAVEFEVRVPPSGMVTVVSGRQAVTMQAALAGRVLTIWADLHSIHLILDGHVLRTVASRLLPQDLAFLAMRGARPAGPPPRCWPPGRPSRSTARSTGTGTCRSQAANTRSAPAWPRPRSPCGWTGT